MAYYQNHALSEATATSLTLDTVSVDENDGLLGIWVQNGNNTITTAPSGWTEEHNDNPGSQIRVGVYSKRATASETAPSATFSASNDIVGAYIQFKDILGSGSFIDGLATTASTVDASGQFIQFPSLTTTVDDCLILYIMACDEASHRQFYGGVTWMDYIEYGTDVSLFIGYGYQKTAGSVFRPTMTVSTGGNRWNQLITVALKSTASTTFSQPTGAADSVSMLMPLLNTSSGATADPKWAPSWSDPTAVVSTIDFNAVTRTCATPNNPTGLGTQNSVMGGLFPDSGSISTTPTTADRVFPVQAALTASLDLTGKLVCCGMKMSNLDRSSTLEQIGATIALRSATNSYRIWHAGGTDSIPPMLNGGPIIFNPEDTGSYIIDEFNSGIWDITDIDAVMYSTSKNDATNAAQYHLYGFYILEKAVITSGGSSSPATFNNHKEIILSANIDYTVLTNKGIGTSQFLFGHPIKIGAGDGDLYWDSTGQSCEFLDVTDYDNKIWKAWISDGDLGCEVEAIAGETAILDTCVVGGQGSTVRPYVRYLATCSVSAIWSHVGALFKNCSEVTLRPIGVGAYSGLTISGCVEITHNGANLSGVSVVACTDVQAITITGATEAALQTALDNLAEITFNGCDDAIRIEYTGTGDISLDFDAMTWIGNTVDIHYNSINASALTAVMKNGSDATTSAISGAATGVTIQAPVDTFTINVNEAGSLIQICTTATQSVLASATSNTLAYEHSMDTVDYIIQKAGFIIQRFTGRVLSGSETVTIELVADPVYNGSHGLIYGTDISYNRATKKYTAITSNDAPLQYSALVDAFITQASLINTDFPMKANGPTAFFFVNDAEFLDTASINNWKKAGFTYQDLSDVTTRVDCAVYTLSTGIPGAAQARYQQDVGITTVNAINTGAIDQTIQVYGDATHGNFTKDTHLVVKYQTNGYQQSRVDVIDLYGITNLIGQAYPIATPFLALDAATGDPAITITIVDHSAAPITVGGKLFSYEVQDGGTNSGLDILREINYNNSLPGTYQGKPSFNWSDIVGEAGTAYETLRGFIEDEAAQLGFWVSRGGSDHPDFTSFQSDDGTSYIPAVQAQSSVPNIVAGSRIQVYNETTLAEIANEEIPGTTYSDSYIDGTDFSAGDVVRVRLAEQNGATAHKWFEAFTVATSDGWSILANQEVLDAYAVIGIDGETVTEFTLDNGNIEIDANDADGKSTKQRTVAWFYFAGTLEEGIRNFFEGITLEDAGNAVINTAKANIFIDNTSARQLLYTDYDFRLYRDDGEDFVLFPSTGNYGISTNSDKVYTKIIDNTSTGGGGGPGAAEIKTKLNDTRTGLKVAARIIKSDGTIIVSNLICPEVATAYYSTTFDLSGVDDGEYAVYMTDSNGNQVGEGDLYVRNEREVTQQYFFNGSLDSVANVLNCENNEDMRGTDGANTVTPDNANILLARKHLTNRDKIDVNTNTLIRYDDDGTTPIETFDLKDAAGNPSSTEVFEKDPQ